MDAAEAVRRWLDAYDSERPWTDEHFDEDLHVFLHGEAPAEVVLDVVVALSRHDLSQKAVFCLGADLAEDLLADAPELLPRMKAEASAEPRLRSIIAGAWATGRMSEGAKAFLGRMHAWALDHDPAWVRPAPETGA